MELSGGGSAASAGEDRLSALPDDVLVLILLKLSTSAAAQTSVLSHRWRRVWALLPVLSFPSPPEPHRLRDALNDHNVLLHDLLVGADDATPESLAVWLPAAARCVSGHLTLKTYSPVEDAEEDSGEEEEAYGPVEDAEEDSEEEEEAYGPVEDAEEDSEEDSREEEEEAAKRGAFEFPCFEKATKISFFLGFQGLAVRLTGVLAHLTELHLSRVWFHGPGELGDVVSSPRCPCLQRLIVEDARGLRDLAIHSESMLWIKLTELDALSQLTVVAPALKELTVAFCFLKSPPVANISAPLLKKLLWFDEHDPSSVHFGHMSHLKWLGTGHYLVYGLGDFLHNQSCLSLLQRFECIRSLILTLAYPLGIVNFDYMMEDMAVLPDITFLRLVVIANGHAFGASAFHALRLCTGIKRLKLDLANTVSEAQAVCSSDCICVQLVEWETEELFLNHLEKVEISGWRGTEHEVAFVKRLFDWGAELKEMTVKFFSSISEAKTKELYQTFQSFSRPGVCMKFYRYENNSKVLYAPKD